MEKLSEHVTNYNGFAEAHSIQKYLYIDSIDASLDTIRKIMTEKDLVTKYGFVVSIASIAIAF